MSLIVVYFYFNFFSFLYVYFFLFCIAALFLFVCFWFCFCLVFFNLSSLFSIDDFFSFHISDGSYFIYFLLRRKINVVHFLYIILFYCINVVLISSSFSARKFQSSLRFIEKFFLERIYFSFFYTVYFFFFCLFFFFFCLNNKVYCYFQFVLLIIVSSEFRVHFILSL